MYTLLRKILFLLNAEFAHNLGLNGLKLLEKFGLIWLIAKKLPTKQVDIMGICFPNAVGLAAGMDKNGDYIDCLGALGFGFLELGTVTPRPQSGNPKPRLFRIKPAQAIINRMGFNNKGVDHLIEKIKQTKYSGIIGVNIGKNFDTPIEKAVDDYCICFRKAYSVADYIAINISSPNTKNLRALQSENQLQELLNALKLEQKKLHKETGRYVPFAVKIAPDLTDDEINSIALIINANAIDAVIATNTTIERIAVHDLKYGRENGGLSGQPLKNQSDNVLKQLVAALGEKTPVIGVGGIMTGSDAANKFELGAKLVQIYTGFVYRGPHLINEIINQY
ncbi:MAG: quinone-dependent dihydroorotate dehydrogenase [Calditrichaeota bacterium]|nr:MAG: quinone-dependent dihydroorotate dehydrogenase [Calditrichota bacterium]